MISYRLKIDKSLSTSSYSVLQIHISGINDASLASDVLELLKTFSPQSIVPHPLSVSLAKTSQAINHYLVLNFKLHRLFIRASYAQQLEWLNFIGIPDKIDRSEDLKPAVDYLKFNRKLKKLGISNPHFSQLMFPIRRIHLVLADYLDDPEISSGLAISQNKNTINDQVIYVSNLASLKLALDKCENHSSLIIDGHWEHGKKNHYGIWKGCYAEEIALTLKQLCLEFPKKIQHIRLLGCHSGQLSKLEKRIADINPSQLFFKSQIFPAFTSLEAHLFRDRAIYLSADEKHPFAEKSLAAAIWREIKDLKIALTAAPAFTYPMHTKSLAFNIGSASETWEMSPTWKITASTDLNWTLKLEMLKSISLMLIKDLPELKTRPGKWLLLS